MSNFLFDNEEMERRLENFLRALHPLQLLVKICGPAYDRPNERTFSIGLGGGYTAGYGELHSEASAWPQLQAYLENDERFQAALRDVESLELRNGRFVRSGDYIVDSFRYTWAFGERTCSLVRERAFQNKDHFPGNKADWESKFDLYLKQNWIQDDATRDGYRTNFEIVDWPQPPSELWPV